jgi:hypothetical protein
MNFAGVAQAIRARLAGDATLSALSTYIGYEKPQDAKPESMVPFPFTVIEDVSATPWDTKTSDGGEQLIQVTTFARPTASRSAIDLADAAAQATYDALHKFDLVVSGSNVVNCLFDSSPGNIPDPDGFTRYRPLTFRIQYDSGT